MLRLGELGEITLGILTKNRVGGVVSHSHFQNKYRLHSNHHLSLKYYNQSGKTVRITSPSTPHKIYSTSMPTTCMIVAIAQAVKLFAHNP